MSNILIEFGAVIKATVFVAFDTYLDTADDNL